MNRDSLELKTLIMDIINKQKQDLTGLVSNPKTDFSRNRKMPYEKMILSLLTMKGHLYQMNFYGSFAMT